MPCVFLLKGLVIQQLKPVDRVWFEVGDYQRVPVFLSAKGDLAWDITSVVRGFNECHGKRLEIAASDIYGVAASGR